MIFKYRYIKNTQKTNNMRYLKTLKELNELVSQSASKPVQGTKNQYNYTYISDKLNNIYNVDVVKSSLVEFEESVDNIIDNDDFVEKYLDNIKEGVTFSKKNNNINESMKLSKEEKDYLWSKIEYSKRKKAEGTDSDLFKMLTKNKTISGEEDELKILNSLEYSFKKRLRTGNPPKGKFQKVFSDIQQKIPSNWMGVKFSNIKSKKSRDDKAPTNSNTIKEIKKWLDINNISYKSDDNKKDLLSKVK